MSSQNSLSIRILSGILLASCCMVAGCMDTLPGGQTTKTTTAKTTTNTTTKAATTNTTTKAATTNATTKAGATTTNKTATVTGTWYYKKEIMKLKQTGASIQGTTEIIGFATDPVDPIESPVPTVGTMQTDGTVKISELVNYLKNPAKNFQVQKVGKLKDANTLVLDVVSGQAPHTQTWIKK